ncbi:unnamed protein product (macronuclear) [Paramecium tetraurelia]|uniref:Uncharacterized protein n=1 Tax=Paramecium tetraurelia TaxID=5888 RepID=A0E7B3_PARTE|nr:uncharacterized protein GSPATT00023908001 [Paramecium tetraurelia]CAK91180.1 unnamed protein product [Paramecium tetraurelia]|eukprot:XP_001458577.1 hypothetical protein (macronuclear) [Paramecium tetraurelia strain d4-2]
MIKKRSSLYITELPTRPASGSTNPDAPSPLKFIRKLTRQASTVNGSSTKIQTCISSVPNKTQEVIQHCIVMVEQLRQQHQERQASRFFHIRSCSMPCDRVSIINSLIDTILPQSPRKPQRSLEQACVLLFLEERFNQSCNS